MDSHAPRPSETVITSRDVQVERKTFTVAFCENHMGKFVRLTETNGGKKNSIIIPEIGVGEIAAHLEELSMRCAVKES